MRCQECGERAATVHVTRIINGQKQEDFLCEICAREKGELGLLVDPKFLMHQFLAGILGGGENGQASAQTEVAGGECAACGMTYQEFSKGGRLGCPACYQHFADNLEPLLKRIHGSAVHTGKVPVRSGGTIRIKREIAELRRQLAVKVDREEFEVAAELRDRIREMENKLRQGGLGDAEGSEG